MPVWSGKEHTPIVTLAPFFDIGTGWDKSAKSGSFVAGQKERREANMETLPSIGLGLIFQPTKYVHAAIYGGYGFNRDLVTDGDNLQDYGIHFAVTVNAF